MSIKTCPICGGMLEQQGADLNNIYYKCTSCGQTEVEKIKEDEVNAAFEMAKRELLGRIRSGFVDWRATQWEQLQMDLLDFINRYDQVQDDIRFQMAIVACMTKGFNILDAEKYTECKKKFKIIDKAYKKHLKALKIQASDPALSESMEDYKESRKKYLKLRNEYRNTKLAWKLVFTIMKKLIPMPFS